MPVKLKHMTNKNKAIVFFSLLFLTIIAPVYAVGIGSSQDSPSSKFLAVGESGNATTGSTTTGSTSAPSKYPVIAGITISDQSSAAELIIYFFNLAVAIGAFIAVIMVVMAGIEWMTSEGNPSKIESAKDKIKNTLLGVAVLLGSYVILNIINSNLTVINVRTLECLDGIKVETKDSKNKIKYNCINQDMSDIGFNILSTKDWSMNPDSIIRVFIYSEPDYKGTITSVNFGGDIKGAKSIYFEWNRPGMYLYSGTDFNNMPDPEGKISHPVFTSTSIKKLSDSDFDNTVSSIKKVDILSGGQSSWVFYQAVVFEDPQYRGSCSFVGSSIPNMSQPSNYYTTPIKKEMSSLVVYKVYGDVSKNRGKIFLYSGLGCSGIECQIEIDDSGPQNVADKCKGHFGDGDEVQSFKITGSLGLVLMTNPYSSPGQDSGICQYWDINDITEGTCYPKLKGESVYDDTSNVRPRAFMAFPVDRR